MTWLTDHKRWLLGASFLTAGVFFIAGILFWGAFNTGMEATNELGFCISCHEMRDTVYQEYKTSIHYKNPVGVRAVCADCHVPKDWTHKIIRKVQASNELYHKLIGTVSTPEKFEAHRVELAQRVWATMKSTDSRECRNCHSFDAMSQDAQKATAWRRHSTAAEKGKTCIDCHQGIAHKDITQFYPDDSQSAVEDLKNLASTLEAAK